MSSDKSLSRQEERVLNLAKQGYGDKQIAQQLGLSTDTVRTYWQRIRQKVGAATRAEIIATVGQKQTAAAIEVIESEKTALQQEIAHRLSTEKALRASEAEWRRLADSMPQMVFVARADGVIFHHNARFYEFTGLTPEEAKGEGLHQVIHPEDLDRYLEKALIGIQTGEPYEEELRIRRHDGVYLWHVNRAAPYRNDQFEIVRWYGTSTDIHDSKLVREQMKRNEARALLAQQIASLGYFEYRADTHEALWSPNLSAMFELPERTDWFDSNEFLDLVVAEDREEVGAAIIKTLREGAPFDAYYRVRLASGRVLHVHSIAKAFVESDKIVRIVGTIQDITERNATDAERDRLISIVESTPDIVVMIDPALNTIAMNEAAREFFGVDANSFRKVKMNETHPAWAWEKVMNVGLPHAIEHGTWIGETALIDSEGREVPISKVIIAHRDAQGELAYVSAIARNISDMKRIEEERDEHRRLSEQVLESSFDIVYIYDICERHAIYTNQAIEAVWGYPLEEMMNVSRERLHKLIHPDDVGTIESHIAALRNLPDGEFIEREYRILTSHRGWRWMQSRERAFRRGEDGLVSQVLGIVQDVTHRKGDLP